MTSTRRQAAAGPRAGDSTTPAEERRFVPRAPATLGEAGLDESMVEGLLLKGLLASPGRTGRQVAGALGLRLDTIRELLLAMKQRKLLVHRGGTATGDFIYDLSEAGRRTARELARDSRYSAPAPVPLPQYLASIELQSIRRCEPSREDLERAFADLWVPAALMRSLGPAVLAGRGMFLFGAAGNGKTSIAQRITRAFGDAVYIPRALWIEGQVVKVFDPMVHHALEEQPRRGPEGRRVDRRWVLCRRPTVIAGGELTLDSLEIRFDPLQGVSEAPVQLKANAGTLVIDDFGRQRVDPVQLLNRWIVPLEHRIDYLCLPDGRKVCLPFDPLLIFATNLDPAGLVDEAFIRRVPYKIRVPDPTEQAFRELLHRHATALGVRIEEGAIDHLLERHYRQAGRPMRCCHPRDLLLQVYHRCRFDGRPPVLDDAAVDEAATAYFPLMEAR